MNTRTSQASVLAALASISLLVSCSADAEPVSEEPSLRSDDLPVSVVHGDAAINTSNAIDWALYGDHLVVFEATAEAREGIGDIDQSETGSQLVGRVVELAVTEVLWSRPDAPTPPESMTAVWDGWVVQGQSDTGLYQVEGVPSLEVGDTYVGLATRLEVDGQTSWKILPDTAARYPFNEVAARADPQQSTDPAAPELDERIPPVLEDAVTEGLESVIDTLDATDPPEWTLQFMSLPAVARQEAISREALIRAAPLDQQEQLREQLENQP